MVVGVFSLQTPVTVAIWTLSFSFRSSFAFALHVRMYFVVFHGNNILEAQFCILFTSTLLSTPESALNHKRIEGSKRGFQGSHLRLHREGGPVHTRCAERTEGLARRVWGYTLQWL